MARPQKDGVDYFPLDVDFFADKKIKLIRGQFGVKGAYIALALIASAYQTGGYYKKWDVDDSLLMSEDVAGDCSPQLITDVLYACLRRRLFDRGIFEKWGVITSAGIQRRYIRMVRGRDAIPIITEYWLLNMNDEKDVPANVLNKVALKSISDEKTPVFDVKTPVSDTGNTPKKSKEKKSKANISPAEEAKPQRGALSGDDEMRLIERIEFYVLDRKARAEEREEIRGLLSEYGSEVMSEAVSTAIRMNGRSVKYLRKCAETAAVRRNDDSMVADTARYDPTYDISEIEQQLDDEWLSNFGGDDE